MRAQPKGDPGTEGPPPHGEDPHPRRRPRGGRCHEPRGFLRLPDLQRPPPLRYPRGKRLGRASRGGIPRQSRSAFPRLRRPRGKSTTPPPPHPPPPFFLSCGLFSEEAVLVKPSVIIAVVAVPLFPDACCLLPKALLVDPSRRQLLLSQLPVVS